MTTVCVGWKKPHAIVVLKPEDGGEPGTSHGMCPDCTNDLFPDSGAGGEQAAVEYAAYVANPTFDPRD